MTLYGRLQSGETFNISCSCGRFVPMRFDPVRGTLVIDHGGEAVWIMPPDEWAQMVSRQAFTLRESSYWAWLKAVHEYEAVSAA